MKRVLVTGGAGFIGSHLVDSLVDSGHEVLIVDNFSLGRHGHLERAGSAGSLTVIDGDIRSADDLRPVADFAPDTVFHMAALHFIPYCNAHPAEALDVNVLGLDRVIRAVRDAPLETFVFPSSGAIYGFRDAPWPETAPARPDEIYGISKWLGEQVMARFHEDRPQVRTVVARLFNTYGPRETNPHVLPDIMHRLHEGKAIELGNLWPKRDLIFVTDTAAGIIATVAGGPGLEVFNVGTGTGTAIQDVLQAIEVIRGKPLDVIQVPGRMREGDGHLISSPHKLQQTGWKPEYDLDAGLGRLLEWEGLL
ncbi:MAG TPA: NAD-dependent epimerase/dehydratase family protein [Streptosporangiaceae bacterium]|nr:NAD-dependent epimerase/dehydratase family protein [Streptosporangiaceae bacterium]